MSAAQQIVGGHHRATPVSSPGFEQEAAVRRLGAVSTASSPSDRVAGAGPVSYVRRLSGSVCTSYGLFGSARCLADQTVLHGERQPCVLGHIRRTRHVSCMVGASRTGDGEGPPV